MRDTAILIVGAGPTGLNLALRLARRGVAFEIIDRNSGPGQQSRAMAVHARTLELYRQIGLADEIVSRGIKIEAMHVREGGSDIGRLDFKDIGQGLSPYPFVLSFPQDEHEGLLVETLRERGVEIGWNISLTGLSQDAEGVDATLDDGRGQRIIRVDYLCGCDGARSRTREALGLQFPGGTYAHRYFVADATLNEAIPNEAMDHKAIVTDGTMSIGADSFVLRLPVRSSGMTRLIGQMPASADDKPTPGFEDVRPVVEPLLGLSVREVNWFSTYRVHHRVTDHFRVGRCFLAGDAGHVHSPAGGQGMNTGIGDAVNLAWKLADVVQGRAAPAILATYESERIAFARSLVASTDRAFQSIVSGGVVGRLVRGWLIPHLFPFITGFAAGRRAVFKVVSQVRIAYEDSALSQGKAGDIHGGDRLPWLAGSSTDNFDPLCSADWQVHVYGEVSAKFRQAAASVNMPLHAFGWSDAAAKAGLAENAAYLIRPDSYVAQALPTQDADALLAYVETHALQLA